MKKDSSGWFFGLVEFESEGQKCLEVCEIYPNIERKTGAASVDWKQFRQDKKMILEDLRGQAKAGVEFWCDKKANRIRKQKIKR